MRRRYPIHGLMERIRPINLPFVISFFCVVALFDGSAWSQNDISNLIDQAKREFKPVSERQPADARADLQRRMSEVENYVGSTSENGKRWLRYLRWDRLKDAISADRPNDFEPFDTTLRQLNRNEDGLESRRFRQLASALQRYRDLAAVASWDKPGEIYGKQLDELQHDLDAYRKQPTPQTELALSRRLHIIDSIGQA